MLQNKIVSRSYNRFEISEDRSRIYKISRTERLADEIEYYKLFPIQGIFPNTLGSDIYSIGQYILGLEYLEGYISLGYWLASETFMTCEELKIITIKILEIMDKIHNWVIPEQLFGSSKDIQQTLETMYFRKTISEYAKLKISRPDLFEKTEFLVNQSYCELITDAHINILYERICEFKPKIIHGDFCLANVLVNPETLDIKLIDPRGSFGTRGILGDPRYDYAKLRHSFHGGYEYLINDAYRCYHQNTISGVECVKIEFLNTKLNYFEIEFNSRAKFNCEDIKIIEGFIFLGMIARHDDDPKRQEAMFYIGQKILNECM